MRCGTCPKPHVEQINRLPPDDGMQKEPGPSQEAMPGLSDEGGSRSILDRVVVLHHEFLEDQQRQSRALQEQLQTLVAEQADLRALLTSQHEQVLQALGKSGDASWKDIHNVFQLPAAPEMPGADAAVKQKRTSSADNSPSKPILDLSKLPSRWSVMQSPTSTFHELTWSKIARKIVLSDMFEAVFIGAILLNLLTMLVQLQWTGYRTAMVMGDRSDDNNWSNAEGVFRTLEFVFATLFLLEAILRISALGLDFLRELTNIFDMFIVLLTCTTTFILDPLEVTENGATFGLARLVRLLRVLRFFRIVRTSGACRELRILARALSGCLGCLFWSMLILVCIILAGAVLLNQLAVDYIEDLSNPEIERKWAYEKFGTISLSIMALWECTFTGSWHRYSSRMILNMSQSYAFFWVPYVIFINFAVMRLIGALFLKETMSVAAVDNEAASLAKAKKKAGFATRIQEIFREADSSGDGKITPEEFEAMLYSERVGALFEQLELEIPEVASLFMILASDDGAADYNEFLAGAVKLKQRPQAIDTINILHLISKIGEGLHSMYGGLCDLATFHGKELDKTALSHLAGQQITLLHAGSSSDDGGCHSAGNLGAALAD